jgi:hypothetical protein
MKPAQGALITRVLAATLFAATLIIFLPAGGGGFVFDDIQYITNNTLLSGGLTATAVGAAFTSLEAGNWHPLTWVSHLVDVSLFGFTPRGHHLSSVVIHALNALLLFLVLRIWTGAVWRSALAAALFALHPLRVESVAWISERKDVLSVFFWLLALLAWHRYVRGPSAGRYLTVAVVFTLGLLSKPMVVTLPFVLLILDFWPGGRIGPGLPVRSVRRLVLEKCPLLIPAAVTAGLTWIAQSREGAIGSLRDYPPLERIGNAAVSLVTYLVQAAWPENLSFFYPRHPLSAVAVAGALILLGTATAFSLGQRLCRPWLAAGWFWYLGTVLPVIGLVQVGFQARADRYTYLPLMGIALVVAWGAGRVAQGTAWRRLFVGLAVLASLTVLAAATQRRITVWRDDRTLLEQALSVDPKNWLAMNNLGELRAVEGNLAGAYPLFTRAAELNPRSAEIHYNLANVLYAWGRKEEAVVHYRLAVNLKPGLSLARRYLAETLEQLGRREEAGEEWREIIRREPGK